ncbi:MAG: prolipoprotein diacylglyceryl transferase [Elusimicrobia bacterium]|nr:prolipoprotein diacylglyceryl transferase [Elusimicrobiota bacterium]
MLPVLLQFGPLRVNSYGLLIAVGGVLSSLFWKSRAGRIGIRKEEDFWLLINVILLCGFVGGRVLFLFEYTPAFSSEFWRSAFAVNSGFSVMGAFCSVIAGVWWFSRKIRADFFHVLDYVCQAAPFWHFFGRLGCFMAGCCFGRPTRVPWGVIFNDPRSMLAAEAPQLLGVPIHPTQLYEAFGNLGIAAFLYFAILPRTERGELKAGVLSASYFVLYALLRFVEEFYRGDTVPLALGMTAAQGFCLALGAAGLALLAFAHRRPCTPS